VHGRHVERRVHKGANRLRIGLHHPRRGRHHLRLRARDAAGNRSRTRTLTFEVRRR
jgi:hypothetical protein